MGQLAKVLAVKVEDPSLTPEPTWYKRRDSSQFNAFLSILIRDFYFVIWDRLYIHVCFFRREYFQLHYVTKIPQFKNH